jgi:hypothetical protein
MKSSCSRPAAQARVVAAFRKRAEESVTNAKFGGHIDTPPRMTTDVAAKVEDVSRANRTRDEMEHDAGARCLEARSHKRFLTSHTAISDHTNARYRPSMASR